MISLLLLGVWIAVLLVYLGVGYIRRYLASEYRATVVKTYETLHDGYFSTSTVTATLLLTETNETVVVRPHSFALGRALQRKEGKSLSVRLVRTFGRYELVDVREE